MPFGEQSVFLGVVMELGSIGGSFPYRGGILMEMDSDQEKE